MSAQALTANSRQKKSSDQPGGDSQPKPRTRVGGASRELIGLGFCLLAAVFYTAANIVLRYLAGVQASPVTVIFVKELVAVVALFPVLVYQHLQGHRVFVGLRVVAVLALVGLAVQMGANLGQQWALGIIGLAVVSPTIFAAMLGSSALLGLLLLGERISWHGIAAVLLVILAIISLNISLQEGHSQGQVVKPQALAGGDASGSVSGPAEVASQSGAGFLTTSGRWVSVGWIMLALLTCVGAGVIYSLLGIAIRWARLQGASVESIVFLVTLMGVVGLGPIVWWEPSAHVAGVDGRLLVLMLLSGIANLLGFASITKGYRMTRVLYANMANASQVAFGAIAGVVLFGERVNRWLVAGIGLTLAGVVLMGYSAAQENNRHHRSPARPARVEA